ncbi:tRNA pseudouridine(13) synthase TruD [bacterium]|nr:tRNA pseudouridine(13) synthase TruD [bacterium]
METLPTWAYAYGRPSVRATFKSTPADFCVTELIDIEFSDSGEHIWLWIEKNGLTTVFVQECIASFAQVPLRDVSYSGLKDKQSISRQWFSVRIPSPSQRESLCWSALEQAVTETLQRSQKREVTQASGDRDIQAIKVNTTPPIACIKVMSVQQHYRKLRIGTHRANQFAIQLRDSQGDTDDIVHRIQQIKQQGFPNYFGEQRFGRGAANLQRAKQLFSGKRLRRQPRSMALSAARSFIFNTLLSERVHGNNWCELVVGDVLQLNGTQSFFNGPGNTDANTDADEDSSREQLTKRLQDGDLHVSAPLWGEQGSSTQGDAATLEQSALERSGLLEWCDALAKQGMQSSRRSLRAFAGEFSYNIVGSDICLQFQLPRGSFATALLRELLLTTESTSTPSQDLPADAHAIAAFVTAAK